MSQSSELERLLLGLDLYRRGRCGDPTRNEMAGFAINLAKKGIPIDELMKVLPAEIKDAMRRQVENWYEFVPQVLEAGLKSENFAERVERERPIMDSLHAYLSAPPDSET
jgi:hypothetical protein